MLETPGMSLRHSCGSELTRQGISLKCVTTGASRYVMPIGSDISADLCMSPCSSDYTFILKTKNVLRVVSEDPSKLQVIGWFPADCLHVLRIVTYLRKYRE